MSFAYIICHLSIAFLYFRKTTDNSITKIHTKKNKIATKYYIFFGEHIILAVPKALFVPKFVFWAVLVRVCGILVLEAPGYTLSEPPPSRNEQ